MYTREPQETGGLVPHYRSYERQKCFIAYSEQAEWAEDLLNACRDALSRPEFDLESDYAREHFDPDIPLRQKALDLIANARCGIYDLSYWRDKSGTWQMPRNVLIELGMAIALNRPALLLRHKSNCGLELPECLKSVNMLEFSGEKTLKNALTDRLPEWINTPPEQDWWSRYCIFGGRVCQFREAHPRARQWGQKEIHCHISDGPDVDRPDFRGVVEEVLGRFSDVTFDYMDSLPLAEGYQILLCSHCQAVRSTPFAIYRITPNTPVETFIAIGMNLVLETQFEYKIPKVLMTENVQDVPSLLAGYEMIEARSDKERKQHLRTFIPTIMHKSRETIWKSWQLPFIDIINSESDQANGLEQNQHNFVDQNIYKLHKLRYDNRMMLFYLDQQEVRLSLALFRLLHHLYQHAGQICTRESCAYALWGRDYITGMDDVALDSAIASLRRNLRKINPIDLIKTHRGVGYMIDENTVYIPNWHNTEEILLHQEDSTLALGKLRYDERTGIFFLDQQPISLTPAQLRLLLHLYRHVGEVCTRESCAQATWGRDYDPGMDADALDRIISNVRARLREVDTTADLIRTVRGLGYTLAL